jgi:hypothetical protein
VALLYESEKHTASAYRWTWKPDTWYDFGFIAEHWQKWFIIEAGRGGSNPAAFAAALRGDWYRSKKTLAVGVAGEGTVTIGGVSVQ